VEIAPKQPLLRILTVAQDQEIAWHNSRKFDNPLIESSCGSIKIVVGVGSLLKILNPEIVVEKAYSSAVKVMVISNTAWDELRADANCTGYSDYRFLELRPQRH